MLRLLGKFFGHAFGQEGATFTGFSVGGWILSMHLLIAVPGTWDFLNTEYFVKTGIGLLVAFISGCLGVMGKDLWSWVKRKSTSQPKIKIHDKDKHKRA